MEQRKAMKILITGNLGYIGPVVVRHFRKTFPAAHISGLDLGFFASNLFDTSLSPEVYLDNQMFADVRNIRTEDFQSYDAVIHLAAISNDPIGKAFEEITHEINLEATLKVAKAAKKAGVKNFVMASSCSVYGVIDDEARKEDSELAPQTAYARSKVASEKGLQELADDSFVVTCHRFATACGYSPRLRLDLVLNDFVFNAVNAGKIKILSDGTPWRPLISVSDMAKSMEWSSQRSIDNGGSFLIVNTGSTDWNFQVRDLARYVGEVVQGCEIEINNEAAPDNRSYKVDFSLYQKLAPNHYPQQGIAQTIEKLRDEIENQAYSSEDMNLFVRLRTLERHLEKGTLSKSFSWVNP
jgi:nucleoside-diphosphate-sugar epimerase